MGLPVSEVNGAQTMEEYVERQQTLAEETYKLVRQNLSRNAQRRKSAYDMKVRERPYEVGDSVWYYYPRKYTRKSPKWQRCYIGPYRVTRVLPPVNCVIQRSEKSKPFVVHVDKLKKCYSTPASDRVVPERADGSGLAANAAPPSPSAHQSEPHRIRRKELRSPRRPVTEPEVEVEFEVEEPSQQRPVRGTRSPSYLKDYECRVVYRQRC